ncbi:hypothetical protein AVEN_61104-1 [Araneus ventricosus]|uniref:Uncharacterized protein n=1 Tax=Araneus ventricosus TaxID=182803 RepID=A0A4Y2QCB7_ARAVE|nr:hypothetical protein AVEN_61104-1 [Araneus ventricosus]
MTIPRQKACLKGFGNLSSKDKGLSQGFHDKGLNLSARKPCFLLTSEPFRYLAERFNPCHGNLCDNPLSLPTTRLPKPFRRAFFAVWDSGTPVGLEEVTFSAR